MGVRGAASWWSLVAKLQLWLVSGLLTGFPPSEAGLGSASEPQRAGGCPSRQGAGLPCVWKDVTGIWEGLLFLSSHRERDGNKGAGVTEDREVLGQACS